MPVWNQIAISLSPHPLLKFYWGSMEMPMRGSLSKSNPFCKLSLILSQNDVVKILYASGVMALRIGQIYGHNFQSPIDDVTRQVIPSSLFKTTTNPRFKRCIPSSVPRTSKCLSDLSPFSVFATNEKNIHWKHPHLTELNILGVFNSTILQTQFLYLRFWQERRRANMLKECKGLLE